MDPTDFRRSCLDGRIDDVRRGLGSGCDPSLANAKGMTPLMLAVWQGDHAHVVTALLTAGADPSVVQASSGWTAATFAGVNGRVTSLPILLASGADVSADWKALHFAVQYRSRDTVPMLLGAGIPVDIRDADGRTALHRAARNSDALLVAALLATGADANAAGSDGRTPLHEACARANVPNVRALLAAGGDADRADANGDTPRRTALRTGRAKIVSALPE